MLLVLLVRSMMGVMLVMGGGHHRLDHGARQHQRGQGSSKQVANPHGEGLLSTRETSRTRGRLTAAPAAIAAAGRAPARGSVGPGRCRAAGASTRGGGASPPQAAFFALWWCL